MRERGRGGRKRERERERVSFIPHLVLQTVSTNSSNRLQLPTNMSLFLSPDTEEERKRVRGGERERVGLTIGFMAHY